MFSLSTPAWLVGLGALAVPLALHLWSRRPSQVVRIGTLDHLAGAPGPMAWGRRLDDLPLLVLRSAILAAAVLGLAGPRWRTAAGGSEGNGTLVIADPALVADSLAFYSDPLVDSLRRSQTPIHLFEDGLPVLGSTGESAIPAGTVGPTLWASLVALDSYLPPEQPVLVIARATAGRLGPARPALGRVVRWYEPAASLAAPERVVASWPMPPDTAIELLERPEAFTTVRFHRPAPGRVDWGGSSKQLNERSATFTSVQLIQGQQDTELKESVLSAVDATIFSIQGFLAGATVDQAVPQNRPSDRGLIVWLDVQSVSDSIAAKVAEGAWLLQLIPAESGADLASAPVSPGLGTGLQTAPWTAPLPTGTPGAATLVDPAGRPLVTTTRPGAGRWFRIGVAPGGWRLLSGGDPSLPLLLHHLLSADRPSDAAPVRSSQATPTRRRAPAAAAGIVTDFSVPLLWLALLLLAAERTLVHVRQRGQA